jgi:uncharacterized protein
MVKTLFIREKYLKQIRPFINKGIIKVVIGQRRVGKSYLLYQIIKELKDTYKNPHIIYINKESYEFDNLIDYKKLLQYVDEHTDKRKKKTYLFIDEVQDIVQFEKALRSLLVSGKYDIYVTGSNAHILSGELATYLSGRYIEIPVYPLSYKEFLQFHNMKDSDNSLLLFLKYGGLPYLINLDLIDEVVYPYLQSVYNSILLKDVVGRYNIRNIAFLENLVDYLVDNICSLLTAKKISDFLKSQRLTVSPNIVLNYLEYLENTFFIYKMRRFDIKGKKIFEINDKFYFEDLGLRHSIKRYAESDIHKLLENIVFLHLKYLGYKVFVGKIDEREIDFVCKRGKDIVYVQVAYIITKENRKREFENLLDISDNYKKIVVSMNNQLGFLEEYKGVEHVHIRDFLLKDF